MIRWLTYVWLVMFLLCTDHCFTANGQDIGSIRQQRTLVILDSLQDEFSYSNYLDDLRSSDHTISVLQASADAADSQQQQHLVKLLDHGELIYDNFVLFASKAEKILTLTVHDVLVFSEHGGSVVVAVDDLLTNCSFAYELALTAGVKFLVGPAGCTETAACAVIDHFSFHNHHLHQHQAVFFDHAKNTVEHENILTRNYVHLPPSLTTLPNNTQGQRFDCDWGGEDTCRSGRQQPGQPYALQPHPLLYRGIAHSVCQSNPLVFTVVFGSETTTTITTTAAITSSINSSGMTVASAVKPTVMPVRLVTAVQSRVNARLIFSGSLELFSNRFFNAPLLPVAAPAAALSLESVPANRKYLADLSRWVFRSDADSSRTSLLRVRQMLISRVVAEGGSSELEEVSAASASVPALDEAFSEYSRSEVVRQTSENTFRVGELVKFSVQLHTAAAVDVEKEMAASGFVCESELEGESKAAEANSSSATATAGVFCDVQVELILLDVRLRRTLQWERGDWQGEHAVAPTRHHAQTHTYSAVFALPGEPGVYTSRVHFNRPGYTGLSENLQFSVRPIRHNEHARFLSAAMPYYLSVATSLMAFTVFSVLFLYYA